MINIPTLFGYTQAKSRVRPLRYSKGSKYLSKMESERSIKILITDDGYDEYMVEFKEIDYFLLFMRTFDLCVGRMFKNPKKRTKVSRILVLYERD